MGNSTLFVHLKLPAFNNFSAWVAELENVNTPEKIRKVYDIFLIGQREFVYFFPEEVKKLDRVILVVFFCKIFKSDEGSGRVWIKPNCCGISVIRKNPKAALGTDASR